MDEHGTDDEICRQASYKRPTRSIPRVHDLYLYFSFRTSTVLHQPPHNVHSLRDTPHVTVPNFARRTVHSHFGHPPGRILEERAEGAPCGHFHEAAIEHTDPAVVRQDRTPTCHAAGGGKDSGEWRANTNAIDGAHQRLRPAYPPL